MLSPARETETNPIKTLIIGGGIAGVVLAILLERKGHVVTIAEQSREWLPVGGGITLTLNGVRVLQGLGLLDGIAACANEVHRINITDRNGTLLSSFNLDRFSASYAKTYTIHRAALHNLLLSHLHTTTVLLNTTFTNITDTGDKVDVTFNNSVSDHYDMVAGCDGINSSVRARIFPSSENKYAGYGSWRFVAHNVATGDEHILTEMWGRGKRFGIVPLGNGTVHCFASMTCKQNSIANKNISIDDFRKTFSDFGTTVQQLTNTITTTAELIYNDLEDVQIHEWHSGRIVLVGDAAHGMTPNLTQGASMAIEDACVLADTLSSAGNVAQDVAHYYGIRKGRVAAIQKKSRQLGMIGQLNNPVLCALRNQCWRCIPDKWIQNDLANLLVADVPYL